MDCYQAEKADPGGRDPEAGSGRQVCGIKMHFGELGNVSFLRPNYARAVVDVVKELGGRPFLTDCNTMYPAAGKTPWSTWSAPGRTALLR